MNDLISRSYILNIIEMWMKVPSYSESERNIMRAIDYEVRSAPSADPGWIPVTERLPEEDKEVLITYKGKGDELDKPYSDIDITTYGQMYFGGNKVGNYKHWRSPFQYFNDNYEVTAWQPLPEPFKGG